MNNCKYTHANYLRPVKSAVRYLQPSAMKRWQGPLKISPSGLANVLHMLFLIPIAACAMILRDRRHWDIQLVYALLQRFYAIPDEDPSQFARNTPWLAWFIAVLRAQASYHRIAAEKNMLAAQIAFLEDLQNQSASENEELRLQLEKQALPSQIEETGQAPQALAKEQDIIRARNRTIEEIGKVKSVSEKRVEKLATAHDIATTEAKQRSASDANSIHQLQEKLAIANKLVKAAEKRGEQASKEKDSLAKKAKEARSLLLKRSSIQERLDKMPSEYDQ